MLSVLMQLGDIIVKTRIARQRITGPLNMPSGWLSTSIAPTAHQHRTHARLFSYHFSIRTDLEAQGDSVFGGVCPLPKVHPAVRAHCFLDMLDAGRIRV